MNRCAWWCADCEKGDASVYGPTMQADAQEHVRENPKHEVIVTVNDEIVASWNLP